MIFHHVGFLVSNIEKAYQVKTNLLGKKTIAPQIFDIPNQKVRVCFLELDSNKHLEFVEPYSDNSSLQKLLRKGIGYYHLAFIVNNIDSELERLEKLDYKLISVFSSPAFDGRRCSFLLSPTMSLIELIEKS